MTRESRHLKISGFSDNVTEDTLLDHFNCYGRVQKVEFLKDEQNCAVVSFMDLRTAANAINADHDIRGHTIKATYYEPGATTLNTVIQIHDSTEALHNAQHRRQAFSQQNYQRNQNRSQGNWYGNNNSTSSGGGGRSHDEQTFVHSNVAGGSRTNNVGGGRVHRNTTDQKRPSSRLSGGGRNQRRPSAGGSSTSGDESCSRSRSRSSHSSRSPSLSASSRGSRTIGGDSSRYSVDSRGRLLTDGDQQQQRHLLNSKDGESSSGGGGYNKNAGILVRNLPLRSTDSSLKDGLFFTYKKHGKVVSVKVVGEGPERYAVVTFRRSSDTQKAIDATNNVMFFGSKISVEVAPAGLDVDDNERRPLEKDIDQYHPKSSRTLYVGNLENRITPEQLRHFFERFGDVVDVDIKNRETPAPFAFVQFTDIVSVVKAIHAMEQDGYIGSNKIKVGFGKPLPSPMVWIDELPEHVSSEYLSRKMNFYGSIPDILIDKLLHQALITYDCIEAAQSAVQDMKGRTICSRKVQIDFCSRELHDLFVDRMFRTNQLRGREAIYLTESLLPSSSSQRLSMSRGNSYEMGEFYAVDSYYDPAGSTSSKTYGMNRRSGGQESSKHRMPMPPPSFEERPPYEYGDGEFDEYESSTRDFSRSQEQNQRNAYRTKGRSLTPPQASRHSSNRSHHETGGVVGGVQSSSSNSGWNCSQRSQDDYRSPPTKRARSPGAVNQPKKRSSSIDRNDFRRYDSSEFYNRSESPMSNRERFLRRGGGGGDFLTSSATSASVGQKKPRTPPSPTTKRNKRKLKSSSSSDDTSSSGGQNSTNGSSSSSATSDDSSSESDNNSTTEAGGGGGPSSTTTTKEDSAPTTTNNVPPAPPSAPITSQSGANLLIQNSTKDPSPDIQKLQRERAQLLQMLETLDGEEKIVSDSTNLTTMPTPFSAAAVGKKTSGDKRTPSLSEIFDISWMEKLASKKQYNVGGSSAAEQTMTTTTLGGSRPSMNFGRGYFFPSSSTEDDNNALENSSTNESHRQNPSRTKNNRLFSSNNASDESSSTTMDVVGDDSSVDNKLKLTATLKNSILKSTMKKDDFLEANCAAAQNNLMKSFDSIVVKQENLSSAETSAAAISSSTVSATTTSSLTTTTTAISSTSSGSKNELATPLRASLKSRKIPLDVVDGEQINDPRTKTPTTVVDLPIPHFVKKCGFLIHSSNVTSGTSGNSNSTATAAASSSSTSPLKSNRPDLKIETVAAQGSIQTHVHHVPLQTRSSSGSDLSPLLSNGGDMSASSDALMSPPSASSICWPTPSTDIFGESLSPVTPVSGESRASFEERIKALDDKFTEIDRMFKITKERPMHRDYYSKYKVVKKPSNPLTPVLPPSRSLSVGGSSSTSGSSAVSASSLSSPIVVDAKNTTSSFVLTKTSIFDQDSQRLATIDEKYNPTSGFYTSWDMSKTTKSDEVRMLKAPLTINIPPSASSATSTAGLNATSTVLPTPPPSSGALASTPISPPGPLQGILKNKPKTPTIIGLPPTTPITPATPLDGRIPLVNTQPAASAVDPRAQRKDSCLKSPTNVSATSANVRTSATPATTTPTNCSRTLSFGGAGGMNVCQKPTNFGNDSRIRLPPSTPSTPTMDPRLLNRSGSFPAVTAPKQEKTFGRQHERPSETKSFDVSSNLTANLSVTTNKDLSKISATSSTKLADGGGGQPKELRNKDLDELFKSKESTTGVGERSSGGDEDASSLQNSANRTLKDQRLPKIQKKPSSSLIVGRKEKQISNVEREKFSSSMNFTTKSSSTTNVERSGGESERKKEISIGDKQKSTTTTVGGIVDKEKRMDKDRNEKINKEKDKDKQHKIVKTCDELRRKQQQLQQQQQRHQNKSQENSGNKSVKQMREEKLSKLLKHKRIKSTSGSAAKPSSSDDDSSDDTTSDSELETEKRVEKNLSKEWKKALEAAGEPVGLSMYDRVKRRSSATYTDPWKHASAKDKFSLLREQRSNKSSTSSKHHRRVKCSDDSTDDDDIDEEMEAKKSADDNNDSSNDDEKNKPTKKIVVDSPKKQRDKSAAATIKKHTKKKDKEKLSISDVWSDESAADDDENDEEAATKSGEESDKETTVKKSKHHGEKIISSSSSMLKARSLSIGGKPMKERHKNLIGESSKEKSNVVSDKSSTTPQKRGPGRPKKNRQSENDDNTSSPRPRKESGGCGDEKEKSDKEKKKQKLKLMKQRAIDDEKRLMMKKKKLLKKQHAADDDEERKQSLISKENKKRKRLEGEQQLQRQSTAERHGQLQTPKKIKLEVSSPNSSSNSSTSGAGSGSGFVTKAAKKQVDLTPPVNVAQPTLLITKAAKKAVDFGGGTKEKSPQLDEKTAEQANSSKTSNNDEQRCGIQSLDNAEISADIVEALKRSIGESDEPMETEPIEVMVQEVVVAEIEPSSAEPTSMAETTTTNVEITNNNTSSSSDKKRQENVAELSLGALTVKVDELGDILHQDLAEQKSDASSHVDEVIDEVVHGYVEIDPEKLRKMAVTEAAAATTKISPVELSSSSAAATNYENEQLVQQRQNRVSSVDANVSANIKSPEYHRSSSLTKSDVQTTAEGLLATAQQQRQDLLMKQMQQQTQRHVLSDVNVPSSSASSAAAVGGGRSQPQPSTSSSSLAVHTPPGQQMPPFLATSTPTMNQIQNVGTASYPPPHRTPTAAVSAANQYATAAALYDMQMQQKWAVGLLAAGAGRTTGQIGLEQEFQLREQQARFMAEQQRQAAAAAAAVQQQQQRISVSSSATSSTPNYLASAQQPMMTNSHVNEALMNHRWLLERYPVVWQGLLALKNDNALVQMHLVSGNLNLLPHSLPVATDASPIPVLRIMQRMRLEPQQLDGVGRRMQLKEEHCVLVVLPCGQDRGHIIEQSTILNNAFITYLQQKQAAGIINIVPPGATVPAYVVHVFPPCEFAQQNLMTTACDFLQSIVERQTSFLFVVVTTVQGT